MYTRVSWCNEEKSLERSIGKVERPLDLVAVDLFGPLPKGRGGVIYIFAVSYTHLDVYKRQR